MNLFHLFHGSETLFYLREYWENDKSVSCFTSCLKHKSKHMVSKHMNKGGDANNKVNGLSNLAFCYLVFSNTCFT